MPDSEWYCVETSQGTKVSGGDQVTEFHNKETGAAAARNLVPIVPEDTLDLVKYTRKVVKTFTRTVTVEESDLPT